MLVVANCVSVMHDLLKIFTKVLAAHLAAAPHSMTRGRTSRVGLREDDTAGAAEAVAGLRLVLVRAGWSGLEFIVRLSSRVRIWTAKFA
jgi:hypothetical protein